MFNVKQSDADELLSWVISCQREERYVGDVTANIVKTEGLRVDPVPIVEDEPKWEPSGLYNPIDWRKR